MERLTLLDSISGFTLSDSRLNKRLGVLYKQLQNSVGQSTPHTINNRGQTKAYYRFINNKKVSSKNLINGYGSYSRSAVLSGDVILAIQDTTTLNYSTNRSAVHLDCLESEKHKGFMLHNHLLMNELGVAMGLFSQQFYARTPESLGKSKTNKRKHTPLKEKESYRWLEQFESLQEAYKDQTDKTIIELCDREADIHEVLQACKYEHIHYIIRSSYERSSPNEEASIWQQVANEPYAYEYTLNILQSNQRMARVAKMQVRYKPVTITASYRKDKSIHPQDLWILETKEISPTPEGEKPIHWRLLTSIPITSCEIAAQIIGYYVLRWIIERFHYVLKQGLNVEDLQIENPEALKNAIILKSWIALEVMTLTYTTRANPTMTLKQAGFTQQEYQLAYQYAQKRCNTKEIKQNQPTLIDFTRIIAQIGGHSLQAKKEIGIVSIWRGWNTFNIIRDTAKLMSEIDMGNQ